MLSSKVHSVHFSVFLFSGCIRARRFELADPRVQTDNNKVAHRVAPEWKIAAGGARGNPASRIV